MFRFGVALVVLSSAAQAAEVDALCTPAPVTVEQVTATGTYQGQQFAFTVTIDGKPQPGFDDPPPVKQADAGPCPLTS